MKDRFYSVVKDLVDLNSDQTIILAVSGGVDSVVMAHLFSTHHIPIIIAHCNFQLRGNDSEMDEEFVLDLAHKLNIDVKVKRFDTDTYAKEQGLSIQMAARNLRYDWFNQLSNEMNAPVAIAHNANDVVETVLFNLSKGTGIAGLHGISEKENYFFRPLLWARRDEILAYAEVNNLDWREDASNESEKYMRNLVRKSIIPQFERINPSFIDSLLKTTSRLKDVEEVFQHSIDKLNLISDQKDHVLIHKEKLSALPGNASVLYYLLKPFGFNFDQTNSVATAMDNQGAIFYSDDWVLNVDRTHLILSKNVDHIVNQGINIDEEFVQLHDNRLKIKVTNNEDLNINKSNQVANLDFHKLSFPLILRNWQEGDRFRPLGMEGQKLVSDFLIDEKVPLNFKRKQLVLISNDEIVWLVGLRIDERYKISGRTKKVYILEVENN